MAFQIFRTQLPDSVRRNIAAKRVLSERAKAARPVVVRQAPAKPKPPTKAARLALIRQVVARMRADGRLPPPDLCEVVNV